MDRRKRTRSADEDRPWTFRDRHDPFHLSLLWSGGVAVAWDSVRAGEELRALNTASGRPDRLLLSADGTNWRTEFDSLFDSREPHPVVWQVVGVLGQHRVATMEQIAACAGLSFQQVSRSLNRLWLAGVVRRGRTFAAVSLPKSMAATLPVLWRLDHKISVRDLAMRLPVPALLSTTGGNDLTVGPPGEIHNLLATETMLRVAEHCESALTVLGERSANLARLTGAEAVENWAPDFVVVRQDRMKIAVEVTRTHGPSVPGKVARWAEFLKTHGGEWAVIWLDANASSSRNVSRKLVQTWRKALEEASMTVTERQRVARRVGFAGWQDWFPARLQVSAACGDLAARFATDARFSEFVEVPAAVEFELERTATGVDDSWVERSAILAGCPWRLADRMPKVDPWLWLGDETYVPNTGKYLPTHGERTRP